jgi:thiosulfate oxidation carrier protein SoxY
VQISRVRFFKGEVRVFSLGIAGEAAFACARLSRPPSAGIIVPTFSATLTTPALDRSNAGKALGEGKIKLDLPTIAENGLVVPLNLEVKSPMTDNDYVKAVHVFADGNPNPGVAYFTPMMPKAASQIRMRLAQTQSIVAVAEMSDGSLYTAKREVKVTIGGCGG